MTMTRGGSGPPWATLRSAPILRSAIFFSSRISTERPACLAMASAFSARMRGASLQIPQGGAGDFAKRRTIPLLALPCSDEEQTRGLEASGSVDQSELQHLAGQLPAFCQLAQQTRGGLVELGDAALNGVGLFKNVRNQGVGFECCKRLGYERDLHGALSPPIVVHGLFDFPASFLGAFVLAAVPGLLALRQGDFDLGDAVTKVDLQGDDGQTLGLGAAGELVDFPLVKQKLSRAQRLVVPGATR